MADAWDVDSVAMRFTDAMDTARKLPPVRVQGYTSTWPATLREEWEAYAADDARPLRVPPSPKAVERMLAAMHWVQWLDVEQRHLVWMRAKRHEWNRIGRRFGCDRVTAWRRWQVALQLIADRLNEHREPVG